MRMRCNCNGSGLGAGSCDPVTIQSGFVATQSDPTPEAEKRQQNNETLRLIAPLLLTLLLRG